MNSFDEDDDGNQPELITAEEGKHLVNVSDLFSDSIINADTKAEILLLGESVECEVGGVVVPAVNYEDRTYVVDPKYGLIRI
jgi:hypothetical protein